MTNPDKKLMQPMLDIQSRQGEESQVVVKWLNRLHACLRDDFPGVYEQALTRANVSAEQLQTGKGLSHDRFDRVMELVRRSVPDAFFRFMSEIELTDLGMLGYAVLSCPTLGKGLELLARYFELTSDRFTEKQFIEAGYLVIQPTPTWRHLGDAQSVAEDCIAGNWRAISQMLGADMHYTGASAHFSFSEPEYSDMIKRFFSPCPVEYEAEQSELRVPAYWLDLPLTTGNAVMSDLTAAACERVLGPGANSRRDIRRAVRQLLLSRPGKRMLRLEEAAEVMAMSTAQFRKRIYREGTSYKSIVLEVRMKLALHYLESTDLSIQEIAYLLDYAQPGPFSRAFKKCYGASPLAARKQSLKQIPSPV